MFPALSCQPGPRTPKSAYISQEEIDEQERKREQRKREWDAEQAERYAEEYKKILAEQNALNAGRRSGGEPAPGATRL